MPIISAERVITGDSDLLNGWLSVKDGRIEAVGEGTPPAPIDEHVAGWLLPGFVDAHVHGGGGGSFSKAEVPLATAYHRRHGTTTMLASLVSESLEVLEQQIAALLPYVESREIEGIHLEGPFIAPARCGAHDRDVLCPPTREALDALFRVGGSAIKMITLAPELPGALEATRWCRERGIIAALGHSEATAQETDDAVSEGARVVTHLFNAMRSLHHRDSSLAEVALVDDRLLAELILDGEHVSDRLARIAMSVLEDRWYAITDAMSAAGLADGEYRLGEVEVVARDGVVRRKDTGALAGSTLTLDRAFARLYTVYGQTPLQAVQATATRPADLLGRSDLGRIAVGCIANLIAWVDDAVGDVMVRGSWLRS